MISTRSRSRRKKFSRSFWVELVITAALFAIASQSWSAASRPTTAELPLYQGPDREKIILEGARTEGQLVFYNSHTWFKSVAQEFEKKYPFVKVSEWRAEGSDVLKRVLEESRAGRNLADVVESTEANIAGLHKKELLQEHYSPEIRFYDGEVLAKGKRGIYYWTTASFILVSVSTRISFPPPRPPRASKIFLTRSGKARWLFLAPQCLPAGSARF